MTQVTVALLIVLTIPCAYAAVGARAQGQTPARGAAAKADIVAVVGCLKEPAPGKWALMDASAPVASVANAASAKELASLPKSGAARFDLIGVGIFKLPEHRNHSVAIKGLLIKDTPVSRLNMTSLTMVAETCPPTGK